MDQIKWGIIGCGDVTEIKSGPAFNKIDHSELVAVMRRNVEKAEDHAKRHNVSRWYSDADKLINDSQVNAIYIATPPDSHAHYTKKAAQAGKAVYVEKPMGLNHEECLEMISACEEAGVPLFVAYYRRALPYFLKVKELLDNDAIGTVTSVSIELIQPPKPDDFKSREEHNNWRTKPEISGGGYFHDLASHQLDLMEFLLGPIKNIAGNSTNKMGWYNASDVLSASFLFEKDIPGLGLWNFTAQPDQKKDRTTIMGRDGSIIFSTFDDSKPVLLETSSGKEEFDIPYPKHVQQPLIQTVVNDLRGVSESPSTGETGAQANLLMDKITGRE
ncbi:MAG: oxidoreductase [Balneola sp.]|nr:oxidoreductase [Balneola sp.]|tara:strand:+ start:185539 stop:186528 length:990 start_codon:yes stop_codon:yes gene_type:complete